MKGIAALICAAVPFFAQAKTLEAGAGKTYPTLSAANEAAHDGDTILISPGQYFDCAILRANHLTVMGTDAATVVLTDKTCGGKALLVVDGADTTIKSLTLTRARVPDGNGAGIRGEANGTLTVDDVSFINNQDGIITDANPSMHLVVRNSRFTKNGICDAACSHGIYAGRIASLLVDHSIFRQTRDGHDIKSRAASTTVTNCDIANGPDGTGSYLIEIPNGGGVLIRNNTLEKGPKSGNHSAAISIGAEGVEQPTPSIVVEGNFFTNDGDYNTVLVNNLTATEAELHGNILHGAATALHGDGSAD